MISGLPGYYVDFLSLTTSPVTCCSCSCIGQSYLLQAHPSNQPNQVVLRYAPHSSHRFLRTRSRPRTITHGPTCESDSTPHKPTLVGCKRRKGSPALLSKQQKKGPSPQGKSPFLNSKEHGANSYLRRRRFEAAPPTRMSDHTAKEAGSGTAFKR